MKNQKIALITGANGFIGSHLSCKLVEKGLKVIGLSRTNISCNALFNEYVKEGKIELFVGDITTFDFSKLPKADYIYHIAGKVSVWGSIDSFMAVNYVGTKRVLDYAKKVKPECFCQYSSVAVYGFYGYKNLSEEGEKKPLKNGYALSKLAAEDLVERECKNNGIDYVIIRPGNVYGEYDYTSSHEIYKRIKQEKMLISAGGKYESCFVYVGNLVDATILTSFTSEARNTDYNVTDGHRETLKEMFTAVAKEFGVRPKFTNVPAPLAKIFAGLVESVYKLFRIKKTPLITRFSVLQNCADYSFSIDKLRKIGFEPKVSMKEGIHKTVKWYNQLGEGSK
jgi:nucleoside-diphosphate-sugar epimerase